MKPSNAQAYIRQLCCLGLPGDIVIKEFLKAVQAVIPSENNVYTGCDDQLIPTHAILEYVTDEVAELAPIVLPKFFTHERRMLIRSWFKQQNAWTDMLLLDERFYKSDLYNLLWRKLDRHHCLHSPVVQDSVTVGFVCLFRPRLQQSFNSYEEVQCARLTPYIAHALRLCDDRQLQYTNTGQLGIIVMDTNGELMYLCESAKSLLLLTHNPLISMGKNKQQSDGGIYPRLTQLCRSLDAVFQGKDEPPPSFSYTNTHGQFFFRAQWLNKANDLSGRLIGITVEHKEPVKLKILRILHNLNLSPAQIEVSLLLVRGFSSKDIGERLHIKLSTVKDHADKIFNKLEIHHRSELLPKLIALERADHTVSDFFKGTGSGFC